MTRYAVILIGMLFTLPGLAQGGDAQVRAKADALFDEQRFAEAFPLYSQLVSLSPGDRSLNYRFGTCMLFGSEDKEQAIGHLKFATEDPSIAPLAWYWLGRAYHLNYRFKEAQQAYQRFLGTGDKKAIAAWPVEALDAQCRNGEKLLSNLKEITVRNKVEVADAEFFRFYDLSDIGGKIVVLPEELMTSLDKKKKERSLIYLPTKGGPIYFSSYGKDGTTGSDIYRTELLTDGTFAVPVKLAGYINTDQDENYAFMHPDGKTFYFSSKGHNSMGGYDVFRATYDRGLDAFSRPENMDFAVNTPDDDIFYLVDGEQKEACFASGRNSHQGMLHVYRVATVQQPVIISVFKGTYASNFDEKDRKAHIVVEDATTRERVADVRTDMNGNYVLSVPRSGRYRYTVECGPTGKTHGGMVDVPKVEGARAYRQELVLERNGDLERLVIRNYFEVPLQDDMIALALDEIKRRARLDISTHEQVVVQEPAVEEPKGDVMTRAGFTGDIDQAAAVALAKEDAAELEQQAMDLDAQSKEAFAMAVEAASEADRTASEADRLVKEAATADATQQNDLMVEAARMRQRSREANLRARAAYRTGQDLGAASLTKRQQTATAARLATDVAAAVGAKNDATTLPLLVQLKQRLDTKGSPEEDPDAVETARRAVTEHEKTVARAMQAANSKRTEENELADRVARLEREQATASRSRKDELAREIAGYQEQLGYLRKETEAAFNKVKTLEKETATLRGQASLTRHLASASEHGAGSELSNDQVEQLGSRISGTDQRINALAIDERFDAQLALSAADVEARTFDWDLASAGGAAGTERASTQSAQRDATDDARAQDARTTTVQRTDLGDRTTQSTTVADTPLTAEQEGEGATDAGSTTENAQAGANTTGTSSGSLTDQGAEPTADERTNPSVPVNSDGTERTAPTSTVAMERSGTGTLSTRTQEVTGGAPLGNDRFLLENQRAELVQLAEAERNRNRKDSLMARVAAIDAELAASAVGGGAETNDPLKDPELADTEGVDMTRTALSFTEATKDEDIVRQLYADYTTDQQRVAQLPDADERASSLNGLELMLADSIRAEMTRQVAILQLSPQQAEVVLPRVARLRKLKEEHEARGEQALAARQAELQGTNALGTEPTADASPESTQRSAGSDAINDRFVALDRYAASVYASKVEHRSKAKGVDEAVAFRDADVARMDVLTAEIDSLEEVLLNMPVGRERDKLRKSADQKIDERLIVRTDMGQRSAFLTKEEWRTATDSMATLKKEVSSKSLAMDEPLVLMAQGMEADAKRGMEQAAALRKRADRIEDIIERDSLYRQAYRTELLALREMDRAITVQNHLAGTEHVRGESLTYEEVASKVLGIPLFAAEEPLVAERAAPTESSTRAGGTTEGVAAPDQERNASSGVAPTQPLVEGTEQATGGSTTDERTGVEGATSVLTEPAARTVQGTEGEDSASTNDQPAAGNNDQPATPITSEPAGSMAAAELAAAQIERAEARLQQDERLPAHMYERFLGSETATATSIEARDADVQLLSEHAERSMRDAASSEQASVQAADRATAYADSAATARKKRDRERLEQLAVRERTASDSLHRASLLFAQQGEEATRSLAESEASKKFSDRLVKFYYLDAEEQALVMQNEDRSRYFQAKTRALEQYDAADEAAGAAKSNKEVATVLMEQARAVERDAADGKLSAADAATRASVLEARAAVLFDRADSLENVALRLRGAAGINENQASVMLQGMPADRSSEIMALEMRTRRTETLLAEARDQAGRPVPSQRDPAVQDPASGNRTTVPVEPDAQTPSTIAQVPAVREEPTVERSGAVERLELRVPEVLTANVFELRAPEERREATIPMDAEMPSGVVFKVQIGAFRKPVPQEAFSDMTPVMGETVGNGLVRYTAGLFTGFEGAAAAKDLVRDRGYRDAFVVAYRDGKRIPLGEAMRAERASTSVARNVEPGRPASGAASAPVPSSTNARPEGTTATIARPVPTVVPAAEPDAATILASYPATAEEVIARFAPPADATSYYNVPGAAPARQVETVKGLFFTVQVGVYSKPVPLDKLFNITPLNSERTETLKVRYTTGMYLDLEQARIRKDETVGLGVKDAFITAYLNGKRIPMREANALLEKFGPSILAKP